MQYVINFLSVFFLVYSWGQGPMSEGHYKLNSNRLINPVSY